MKWFRHFSNAHDNNKLTKVRMKYGADGYATYFYCLELIAGDLGTDEINFELKHDAEVIGFNLKIDSAKVEEMMMYMVNLNLFAEAEGRISCIKLAKYLDKKNTRNNSIHKIIDASKVSGDGLKLSRTVPDESGQTPLERERERELDYLYINNIPLCDWSSKELAKWQPDETMSIAMPHIKFTDEMISTFRPKLLDWKDKEYLHSVNVRTKFAAHCGEIKAKAGEVKPRQINDKKPWQLGDAELTRECKRLKISTHGKSKQDLINSIRDKS